MTFMIRSALVAAMLLSGAAVVEMIVALRWIRSRPQWYALFFPSGAFFVMSVTVTVQLWSGRASSSQNVLLPAITILLAMGAVGGVTYLIGLMRAQEARDAENEFLRMRYERLFKQNDLPILVSEAESLRIVDANEAASDLFEIAVDGLLARTVEDLGIERDSEDATVPADLRERTAPGLRLKTASGAERELVVHRSVVGVGNSHLHYDIIEDVSERNAARRELVRQKDLLAQLADHDPLTQLPNRRVLDSALERAVAHARRGTPATLLFIDVDDFKSVNDTRGHQAGDEVLVSIAGLLGDAVREGDVVARLGGDEFAILLEMAGMPVGVEIAGRLIMAMRDAHPDLGLSIGITGVGSASDSADALRRADRCMYEAKSGGKNRIVTDSGAPEGAPPTEAGV